MITRAKLNFLSSHLQKTKIALDHHFYAEAAILANQVLVKQFSYSLDLMNEGTEHTISEKESETRFSELSETLKERVNTNRTFRQVLKKTTIDQVVKWKQEYHKQLKAFKKQLPKNTAHIAEHGYKLACMVQTGLAKRLEADI